MLCGCVTWARSGQAACCEAAPGDRWRRGPLRGGKGKPTARVNCKDRCSVSLCSQRLDAPHSLTVWRLIERSWSCCCCCWFVSRCTMKWSFVLLRSLCQSVLCCSTVPAPIMLSWFHLSRMGAISDSPLIESELEFWQPCCILGVLFSK